MTVINKLASSKATSPTASLTKLKHNNTNEFRFKAGTFKLNNVRITLEARDTLDTIVKKFNDKKLAKGIRKNRP